MNPVAVVAASAGGLQSIIELLSALPPSLPASVIIIQHLPPSNFYESKLCEILGHYSPLPVKWIEDGEALRGGTVYLCPQDVQSRVTSSKTFDISEKVRASGIRPAADPLFASAADVFGENVIAIVLTGALSDGAKGAECIARAGGSVFVQDRETALYFDMPRAAIRSGAVHFIMPPVAIAHALTAFAMVPGARAWFRVQREQLEPAGAVD